VVLHDRVLDVTNFLKDHPGGVLAIVTFAGKDATAEFDMIHPPDVIEKYLDPAATRGVVAGSALAAASAGGGGAAGGGGGGKVGKGKDDAKIWGKYPHETHATSGSLINTVPTALYLMVMSFLKEIVFTIFSTIPIKVTYSGNVSTTGKVMGLLWVVCLCCAVFLESVLFFAALCCCAVVFSCLSVCLDREEELASLRYKLLEP
jgi:hypothetical protein